MLCQGSTINNFDCAGVWRIQIVSTGARCMIAVVSLACLYATVQAHQRCFCLLVGIGRELQPVPVRIVEVEGVRALVVGHEVGGNIVPTVVGQAEVREPPQKLRESRCSDTKRNEVEPGRLPFALRCAREQRKLRVSVVWGDHQGAVRVVRPVLVAGQDFEAQDVLVPRGRLMPIRNEELDVVDLVYPERAAGRLVIHSPPLSTRCNW